MIPEANKDNTVEHDEDVKFEMEKEPAIPPLSTTQAKDKEVGETTIPAKEDTLGNSDFPPLSDKDKEPKLASSSE